jgi:hypothetical protein
MSGMRLARLHHPKVIPVGGRGTNTPRGRCRLAPPLDPKTIEGVETRELTRPVGGKPHTCTDTNYLMQFSLPNVSSTWRLAATSSATKACRWKSGLLGRAGPSVGDRLAKCREALHSPQSRIGLSQLFPINSND